MWVEMFKERQILRLCCVDVMYVYLFINLFSLNFDNGVVYLNVF